jgi:hypothetical protein
LLRLTDAMNGDGNMARRAMAELMDLARDAYGAMEQASSRAANDAGPATRRVGWELSDLWSRMEELVRHEVRPRAREAGRAARPHLEEGRDIASDAALQLRDAARARPLLAIGVAVVATYAITSMLQGSRRR